jgi:S-adenosylmethionine:tRNA ribosyltransferase-isomerase
MTKIARINLDDFNYELPKERIAQYPPAERDSSKILIYRGRNISEDTFNNVHDYIPTGSLLVFNDTRVIRARILFRRKTGATIEIFCLEPSLPSEYTLSLGSTEPVEWKCLIGNQKKWKNRTLSTEFKIKDKLYLLSAERLAEEGDSFRIRFLWNSKDLTFGEVIEACGHIPLPPYISRKDEENDVSRYQTVYSMVKGSVAAPTAGLHFTKQVFTSFEKTGIKWTNLTLHVGAGTFQPVKSDSISDHEMHTEHFFISETAIESVYNNIGNIIAVGTTTVRTLESLYWLGVKIKWKPETGKEELFLGQWEPYSLHGKLTSKEALESLLVWMKKLGLREIHVPTRIIIVPGYKFRMIDGMITNFHQPRSTLLLLISAWTGDDWKKIYSYAMDNNFRFLSYGDSSLLLRSENELQLNF